MNKKLIIALIAGVALTGFAAPGHHGRGPGRGSAPALRHGGGGHRPVARHAPRVHHVRPASHHVRPASHHVRPRWGYGPGLHYRPGPASLVGWRRGALHPHYRSCWFGDVWYDAYGYAYYYPGYSTTTVVTTPVVATPVVTTAPVVTTTPVVTTPVVTTPMVQQQVIQQPVVVPSVPVVVP